MKRKVQPLTSPVHRDGTLCVKMGGKGAHTDFGEVVVSRWVKPGGYFASCHHGESGTWERIGVIRRTLYR